MKFTVMTLFPEMIDRALQESVIGRARERGLFSLTCMNIRDYSTDKHRRVDDYPFGGGSGMVMQCQPIYDCFKALCQNNSERPHTVYLSPRGTVLTQQKAKELSRLPHLAILCGHYEGVDQRVLDEIIDEEISIGDYVLTGGELPACVLIDCVARMLPGVLASEDSFTEESHFSGLLEHPQYTQPRVWHGKEVPPVLTEGNHRLIDQWKRQEAIAVTEKMRPDLIRRPIPDGKRLRFLTPEDEQLFIEMAEEFYQTPGVLHAIPTAHHAETFRRIMEQDPYVNAYLIRYNREIAGYCLLSHTYSNEAGGLTVWIEELYTLPAFRGHRLGQRALREILTLYKDKAKRFRLEINPGHFGAKKIYGPLGFQMFGYQQMVREDN